MSTKTLEIIKMIVYSNITIKLIAKKTNKGGALC